MEISKERSWHFEELGSFGTFKKGKGISKKELVSKGYPCVTYGEIYTIHHDYIKEFKSFINSSTAEVSQRLIQGDLLFASSGEARDEIGKAVAYVDNNPAYAGGDIIIFRQKEHQPIFLGYILNSEYVRRQLFKVGQGHSVVHVYTSQLEKVRVPLPPLPEQKRIAAILSTWDKAITHCEEIITQLEQRNKGLAQQLLTGKTRLPGFTGEWREIKASEVFANSSIKNNPLHLNVLSATQENGVVPRDQVDINIKYDKQSLNSYKRVSIGDFVISLRSFQGGIEYSEYDGIISPAYTILKNKIPISDTYYRFFFKSIYFIRKLQSVIYGIRDGKQINSNDFSILKVPYPTIQEQQAIASILNQGQKEIDFYKDLLDQYKQQKKGMMQQLLTGKVRVAVAK